VHGNVLALYAGICQYTPYATYTRGKMMATTDMQFYDNTRVSEFRRCPRRFYFRHVRDWTTLGTSPALVFGSSWHEAMDTVWGCFKLGKQLSDEEIASVAFESFCNKWAAEGMTPFDQMDADEMKQLKARTPMTAYEMIFNYVGERRGFLEDIEILDIEPPFAVPLDPDNPNLWYVGRLDKVWKRRGDIHVMEHKTTSLYSTTSTFRS